MPFAPGLAAYCWFMRPFLWPNILIGQRRTRSPSWKPKRALESLDQILTLYVIFLYPTNSSNRNPCLFNRNASPTQTSLSWNFFNWCFDWCRWESLFVAFAAWYGYKPPGAACNDCKFLPPSSRGPQPAVWMNLSFRWRASSRIQALGSCCYRHGCSWTDAARARW